MGSMGIKELVIILVVVLLIFGTKKVSSIGADLGRAVKGFKQAMSESEHEDSTPKQLGGKDAEFPEVKKAEAAAKTAETSDSKA
jgi:sec-independent protein translocase protein TatA